MDCKIARVLSTLGTFAIPTIGLAQQRQAEQSVTVRAEGDVERTPATVTSVDLGNSGRTAASLAPLLDEAPGLQVRSTGDALSPSYVTLRGASTAQVTIAIDGIILNDSFAPSVDLSQLAPAMFSRANVYRGTAPLRLGFQGLGGTIELITRPIERSTPAWLTLATGSFTQRRVSAYVAGRYGALQALTTASYRGTSGDYLFYDDHATPTQPNDDNRNQIRQNASSNGIDVLFRGCVSLLCLTAIGNGRLAGLPGPGSLQFRETYITQGRLLTRLAAKVVRDWGSIELYGSTQWRRDVFGDPLAEVSGVGAQTYGRTNEGGGTLTLREQTVTLSANARVRHESFESGAATRPRLAVLGGVELAPRWERVELQTGVGVEVLSHGQDPMNVLPTIVLASPRAGVRVRATQWLALRASVAQLERAPTLIELFGIGEFIRGNSALKPESSTSIDVGAVGEWTRDRLKARLELTTYARRASQLITLTRTSALALRAFNLRDATVLGVESQLRLQWASYVTLVASYAYTRAVSDATVLSEPTRVPNIPEHDLYLRVDGGWRWIRAGVNLSWLAGLYFDNANLFAAPPRTIAGATITVTPFSSRVLVLELAAQNLFDVREGFVRGNPQAISDFAGYPLPSRSFVVSMQTEL